MLVIVGHAVFELKGLKLKRDKADDTQTHVFILIAHAIRGSQLYGEDCEFYRSLGFVPKSERRTGMVARKKVVKTAPAVQPAAADVA